MHPSFSVGDIIRLFACELVGSELKATAVWLACCRRSFEDSVLRVLWKTQDRLTPLLKCLPQEVWVEEQDGSFVSEVVVFNLLSVLNHLFFKGFPKNTDKSGVDFLPKIRPKNAEAQSERRRGLHNS